MTDPGKYVGYCRVSTDKQAHGLELQREVISNFVRDRGGDLVATFSEIASGGKHDRSQLLLAIQEAKEHHAKLVVTWTDRLTRGSDALERLSNAGIPLIVVNDESEKAHAEPIIQIFKDWKRDEEARSVEVSLIPWILELRSEGLKIPEIADRLNSEGLVNNDGSLWTPFHVSRAIARSKEAGD